MKNKTNMSMMQLRHFLSTFARNESGSAYLTFGLGLVLILVPLFALYFSHGGPNFIWQTGARETLERESGFLTEQYTKLWLKVNTGTITNEDDQTFDQTIFAGKDLTLYKAKISDKTNDGNPAYQTMSAWLRNSLMQADPVRFKDTETVTVNEECMAGKKVLIFQATAQQSRFLSTQQPGNIVVEVKRVTQLPCDFDPTNPITDPIASVGISTVDCVMPVSKRDFTGSGSVQADLGTNEKIRSIVNFAWSLDNDSRMAIGTQNLRDLVAVINGSAQNFVDMDQMATGLVVGNFPMAGGGLGECENSTFENSGACYDKKNNMSMTSYDSDTLGKKNISRKTPFEGVMYAQYTRFCPPGKETWTYQAVDVGDCREEYHTRADDNYLNGAFLASGGFATALDMENYYKSYASIKGRCMGTHSDPRGGGGIDSVSWNVLELSVRNATAAENASQPACIDAISKGQQCFNIRYNVQCLVKASYNRNVYGGKWAQACSALQVDTSGGGGNPVDCSNPSDWNDAGTTTVPNTACVVGFNQPCTTEEHWNKWLTDTCEPAISAYIHPTERRTESKITDSAYLSLQNRTCLAHIERCYASGSGEVATNIKDARYFRKADELVEFSAKLVKDLDWNDVSVANQVTLAGEMTYLDHEASKSMNERAIELRDDLEQSRELLALHPKNTDWYFNWACDTGPAEDDNGTFVPNNGLLSAPYGARVNKAIVQQCSSINYDHPSGATYAMADPDNCSPTQWGSNLVKTWQEYSNAPSTTERDKKCMIPSMPDPTDSVAAYKLSFKPANCNVTTGANCDYPEGFYEITIKNKGLKSYGGTPTDAEKYPENGMQTTWKTLTGEGKWAWQSAGTVRAAQMNRLCPTTVSPNNGYDHVEDVMGTSWFFASGGDMAGSNIPYSNARATYNTTQLGHAECSGDQCPNMAEYIAADREDDVSETLQQERLNIASIAMERRLEYNLGADVTAGAGVRQRDIKPVVCMIDTGDNDDTPLTAKRGDTQCDARNGWYCATSGPEPVSETEHLFLEQVMATQDGGFGDHGVFSFTASNLPASGVVLGNEDDENVTYNPRRTPGQRYTQGNKNIALVQVMSDDVPRLNFFDYSPYNIPITQNPAGYAGINGDFLHTGLISADGTEAANSSTPDLTDNPLGYVLGTLNYGYDNILIDERHKGNQCAIIKQAARELANSDNGASKSKVLVYIGAVLADNALDTDFNAGKSSVGRSAFGNNLGQLTGLRLSNFPNKGGLNYASLSDDFANCLETVDDNDEITLFVVTGIPTDVTDRASYVSAVEDVLENLEDTRTEICTQPFCVFNMNSGDADYDKYSTTPHACAANLFSCMKPPVIK